ncbi:bifunctional diaminohydroxyphosphoribosylaminopyrimidine deaminase/5-amino-6-(5-phosphoribosylamino)uracil reductase RibD [Flavihumibacter sp. UBA7668]|uniref:bifunctional diaminohydroxyphosphoribosylaminopyrimidine deaminase/5-amino-6-(5-phosphoribosylamino)uracil reductase RibD n=1 Tax=Flavihumibacter sp. UBA7668 TaxID=1946542 RepID=UPI0025C2D5A8|nr:bifunctional diaminohydroxyphosphoribosylaminopyrimidine deaminase/5-amino-6-(5-phosphoribosylamino)uracil reductase RibD [Flavihumibacter sp. UBA7668]
MKQDQIYMKRCLQLAALGAGRVAPNPLVGAVLVYNNRIIGEGYHEAYGNAHAEVNCLASVKPEDRVYIPDSTLYVSLEPCAHFGKTPPCADLIIRNAIKKVVVATRDPFDQVNGKGIEKLKNAGVEVELDVEGAAAREQNRRFFTFHLNKRPYIILKWAESLNQAIAAKDKARTAISGPLAGRLVHQWRAEEMAILIGATTAISDDPSLTVRWVNGKNPVRLLIDPQLRVPENARLFSEPGNTIVYNFLKNQVENQVEWVQLKTDQPLLEQLLTDCYRRSIISILVEGGSLTIDRFLKAGYWNEIRQIRSTSLYLDQGYPAPRPEHAVLHARYMAGEDEVFVYRPVSSP